MAELTPDRWHRVAGILDEALDLPPAEQAAYLELACGGDWGLRSDVEALLAADANSGEFLEEPAVEYLTSVVGEAASRAGGGLGAGARIGADCVIHSHVAIRERVVIGSRDSGASPAARRDGR